MPVDTKRFAGGAWRLLGSAATPIQLNVSTTVGDGYIDITWALTGASATSYNVGRDGTDASGVGPSSFTVSAATTTRRFSNLQNGVSYTLQVIAFLSTGATYAQQVAAVPVGATVPGGGTGQPGTPRTIALAGKSGLPFNSLCFLPDTSAAGATAFGTLRKRPMDGLLYFAPRDSWTNMRWHPSDHASWLSDGRVLVTSIPFAPESEGANMNARAAANNYATQQQAMGAWLAANGFNRPNHVIRLSWEANGDWYLWSIKNGGAATFKKAFQNTVSNLRAGGATLVKFDLCFNNGPSQAGADYAAFPGASYCDVIAIDTYDWYNSVFNAADWNAKIATRTPGLQNIRDFAVANGIMWALDEGGNIHVSPGGGDNPIYWSYMWQFCTDPANYPSCAWHNTYNDPGAPADLHHEFSYNPNSWALYRRADRWGGWT